MLRAKSRANGFSVGAAESPTCSLMLVTVQITVM
jgi:hypothetical protein